MKTIALALVVVVAGCSSGEPTALKVCEHMIRAESVNPSRVRIGKPSAIHDAGDAVQYVWDRDRLEMPNALGASLGAFAFCELTKEGHWVREFYVQ